MTYGLGIEASHQNELQKVGYVMDQKYQFQIVTSLFLVQYSPLDITLLILNLYLLTSLIIVHLIKRFPIFIN